MKFTDCGEVVRNFRLAKKLSLRDLSARTNLNAGNLSKFENNLIGITLKILDQIADGLGMQREVLALEFVRFRYGLYDLRTGVGQAFEELIEAVEQCNSPT